LTLSGFPSGGLFSGVNVSGATYSPGVQGNSSVIYSYTDANGCSGQDHLCFFVSLCTELGSSDALQGITLFPNPFESGFYVENHREIKLIINVTDVNGKSVLHREISSSATIELNDCSQGMYFVKLKTDNEVKVYKLVKN
jgi:hypothetical protein